MIQNPEKDKIDYYAKKNGCIKVIINGQSFEKYHRFFADGRMFARFDGKIKPEG